MLFVIGTFTPIVSGAKPLLSLFLFSSKRTLYSSYTLSPLKIDFGSTFPKSLSLFLEITVKNFNSSSSVIAIPAFMKGKETGIVNRESISKILIISLIFFSNQSVS